MKIKITESQLKICLKEQIDPAEKILQNLEYTTIKPFSCVQYEPIKIKEKTISPENNPKNIKFLYKGSGEGSDQKYNIKIYFFKELGGTPKEWISIKVPVVDKDKRSQQLEYTGFYKCAGREITISINAMEYQEADENGSLEDAVKSNSPFSNSAFSNEFSVSESSPKSFNSLNDLGVELSKIEIDFDELNNKI